MTRLFIDLRPLRESRDFRGLWLGSSLSAIGGQFAAFAAMFAIWEITQSPVAVGALGLARAVPLIAIALVGTAFIDSMDRAQLARVTTGAQAVVAVGMAASAKTESVGGLLGLAAVSAALSGLGTPARRALISSLLPKPRLAAAFALNSLSFQIAILTGPVLAGLTTSVWSVEICFLVDAGSFLLALGGLRGLHGRSSAPAHRGWRASREGLSFAVRRPVILGALLSDLSATALAMPMALFPMLNEERFHGDPATLGLFLTSIAVGGVVGSFLSGTISGRARPGLTMTACALTWGLALVVAGLAPALPVVLGALAVAGLADTWSVTSRSALVQGYTPDELRGRMSALEHVVGVAGPEVGNFRAGIIGSFTGSGPAIAIGGLCCVAATGGLYAALPALRRYSVPNPH